MATKESSDHPNINININSDPDDSAAAVKEMDLDANEDRRVGLSKEELMKYATQPFWVRLRNILFVSFWIVWVAILVAAIGYVVKSPGCTQVSAASTNTTITSTTSAAQATSSG